MGRRTYTAAEITEITNLVRNGTRIGTVSKKYKTAPATIRRWLNTTLTTLTTATPTDNTSTEIKRLTEENNMLRKATITLKAMLFDRMYGQ